MQNVANQISDQIILTLIRENNLNGWENLHNIYCPGMYGTISTHTSDKILAEKIFIKFFIGLKQEDILLEINAALCVCLLRNTFLNTTQELEIREINSAKSPIRTNSILHNFFSQSIATKQVAANFKISKQEVRQNLHKGYVGLRSQNQLF